MTNNDSAIITHFLEKPFDRYFHVSKYFWKLQIHLISVSVNVSPLMMNLIWLITTGMRVVMRRFLDKSRSAWEVCHFPLPIWILNAAVPLWTSRRIYVNHLNLSLVSFPDVLFCPVVWFWCCVSFQSVKCRTCNCQLSLFNRDCPYFDPRKSRKMEQFYHMSLFLQKSVCSNV